MPSDIVLSGLLSLLASALVLMASPGPATLSVAATTAAYGFRRSLPYVMGINLGTILVLLAVVLGATILLSAAPALTQPLTIVASLYILYLAFRIATAPPLSARSENKAPGLLPGLLLAIANPKAWLAIAAVYAQATLVPANSRADAFLKCFLLSVMIITIHLVWALAGSAFTMVLRHPKASRAINLLMAAVLVLLVLADIFLSFKLVPSRQTPSS